MATRDKRPWGLMALMAFALSSSACASAQQGAGGWQEVTTPHFHISTDLDESSALETARRLEETRAALLAVAWPGAADPPGRTEMLIARSKQLARFMPALSDGFAVRSTQFPPMIVFAPGGTGVIPDVVPHELAHNLSHWFLPFQPRWFAEGLAVYLQTVRYDADKHEATMGVVPERWVPHQSGVGSPGSGTVGARHTRLIPPTELLAMSDLGDVPAEPQKMTEFYYSSWLLTQHLINHQADRFGDFQVALGHTVDWRNAWNLHFEDVMSHLDEEVFEAARQPQYSVLTTRMTMPELPITHRAMPEAAVHGMIARAALHGQQHHATLVQDEVKKALSLDPNDLNALSASFYGIPKESAQQVELARRAVKAHPESGIAWLMLASVIPQKDPEWAVAVANAKKADPHLPGALVLNALLQISTGNSRAALADTKVAIRLSSPSLALVRAHSVALAANHRCADMRHLRENRIPGFSKAQLENLRDAVSPEERACDREPVLHDRHAP